MVHKGIYKLRENIKYSKLCREKIKKIKYMNIFTKLNFFISFKYIKIYMIFSAYLKKSKNNGPIYYNYFFTHQNLSLSRTVISEKFFTTPGYYFINC